MAVVLISGFMADETLWDELLEPLAVFGPVIPLALREGDLNHVDHIKVPTLITSADNDLLRSERPRLELHNGIASAIHVNILQPGHMIPLAQLELLAPTVMSWISDRTIWVPEPIDVKRVI